MQQQAQVPRAENGGGVPTRIWGHTARFLTPPLQFKDLEAGATLRRETNDLVSGRFNLKYKMFRGVSGNTSDCAGNAEQASASVACIWQRSRSARFGNPFICRAK